VGDKQYYTGTRQKILLNDLNSFLFRGLELGVFEYHASFPTSGTFSAKLEKTLERPLR